MAASPTAVVTDILAIEKHPTDPTKVVFTIAYNLLFVPDADALPQAEQAELVVPDTFSKQDVRNAAHTAITNSVAAKGGTINSNRIFGVDDLV